MVCFKKVKTSCNSLCNMDLVIFLCKLSNAYIYIYIYNPEDFYDFIRIRRISKLSLSILVISIKFNIKYFSKEKWGKCS